MLDKPSEHFRNAVAFVRISNAGPTDDYFHYRGEIKMKKYIRSNSFIFICIPATIVFSFLVALLLNYLEARFLCTWIAEGLSSWVQAVGTICAIVSGFAVANMHIKEQRKKKREEERVIAGAVYLLTHDTFELVCKRIKNALSKSPVRRRQKARTTEMIQIIKDFQISHVPVELLRSFTQIRSQLVAINEGINEFNKEKKNDKMEAKKAFISSTRVLTKTTKCFDELSDAACRYYNIETKKSPETRNLGLQKKLNDLKNEVDSLQSNATGC